MLHARSNAAALRSSGARHAQAVRAFTARPPLGRRHAVVVKAWGEPVDFSAAKVVSNKSLFPGMHQIMLEVGKDVAAGYSKPGQYVQAKVVADGKPGYFAIASAPAAGTTLELLIKTVPGATAGDLADLGAGGAVMVSAAQGKGFPIDRIPADKVDTVLLFATGSGVSPIKAVLESGVLGARKHVQLFYGTRTPDTTAYGDQVEAWTDMGVKVTQVYSTDGKQYIQTELKAQIDGGLLPADGSRVGALLVGHKDMCTEVTDLLTARGVPKENIMGNF